MSTPNSTDQPHRPGTSSKALKAVAALAAVVALVFGANAIGKSSSSSASPTTQGNAPAMQQGGAPPGMGTAVTGTTLTKLKAAATAKYPGTIEHAMQLPDGSYEVHVIQSGGTEVHVLVSKDFKVTGTQQGGPPSGAAPSGQAPPASTSSSS